MNVDRIEPLDKRRSKVFLDGDFAFALYNGELRHYQIEEGRQIGDEVYDEIFQGIVCRRAKERALYLLKDKGRTVLELRQKLKKGWYPEKAIDRTVDFLKRYHYVDDEAYTRNYVELYGNRKSRAELAQSLRKKGIDRKLIKEICEEMEPDAAEEIRKILRRRGYSEMIWEEKQKTIAYLMRRGFSWGEIQRADGEER